MSKEWFSFLENLSLFCSSRTTFTAGLNTNAEHLFRSVCTLLTFVGTLHQVCAGGDTPENYSEYR